jgi:endonuclease G
MSNMLPQSADLNREAWRKLEEYCRYLVSRKNELYIAAGGYGSQGTLGEGKVTIPKDCWKVILVLPEGENDLSRIGPKTRVIAVDMPNRNGIADDPWQKYIVKVSDVEKATGLQFFSKLPKRVRAALKSRKDSGRA